MADTAVDVLTREHRDLHERLDRVRDPNADRMAAWTEAVKRMATHVAVERTYLYPVVKRRRIGSATFAEELRRDYKQMEHLLVLSERRKINSPDMPVLVSQLLDVFAAHEQRCAVLAPALQAQLSEPELEELGARMRGAENIILSHPHPHLLALGPVYQWTTRMASRWDRVRDRTVRNR
jgi:hypothetical protein